MSDVSWVVFSWFGSSPSGKTQKWTVRSAADGGNTLLGEIRWFSNWRQYCFYPAADTIWNSDCLDEVTRYLAKVNREHKERI